MESRNLEGLTVCDIGEAAGTEGCETPDIRVKCETTVMVAFGGQSVGPGD